MQTTSMISDYVPLGSVQLIPIVAGEPSPADRPCFFETPAGGWELIPPGTAEIVPMPAFKAEDCSA